MHATSPPEIGVDIKSSRPRERLDHRRHGSVERAFLGQSGAA
jgi:hypothetical protein